MAKRSDRVTIQPFELCAADLVGPMPPSHGGARYALVIVDQDLHFVSLSSQKTKPVMLSLIGLNLWRDNLHLTSSLHYKQTEVGSFAQFS